jgi:hypothetical protein
MTEILSEVQKYLLISHHNSNKSIKTNVHIMWECIVRNTIISVNTHIKTITHSQVRKASNIYRPSRVENRNKSTPLQRWCKWTHLWKDTAELITCPCFTNGRPQMPSNHPAISYYIIFNMTATFCLLSSICILQTLHNVMVILQCQEDIPKACC